MGTVDLCIHINEEMPSGIPEKLWEREMFDIKIIRRVGALCWSRAEKVQC